MDKKERAEYEQDLNDYWTYLASLDTAEKKGEAKGRDARSAEIARNMKKKGYDLADIAEMTGLSPEEIERLD